jgi:2-polyprenyl-3-methyl-5-hydroxy-6-metoxy-1,4-benzoquinol methylase
MELIDQNCCPLCRSKKIELFKKGTINPRALIPENFKITDSHYGSRWNFSICRVCSYVFSNPTPREEDLVNFYSLLEDEEYSQEAEGRAKNFKTILKRLNKLKKPGNRLLDVGAASGIFLDLARKEGYEIYGIEPSRSLVKEAKEQYDISLFCGTLKNYPDPKKFSVIALIDIIEHLTDPVSFLEQVSSRLQKNGILVLVTPDIRSVAARMTGKKWWHYRIAHLNFFNKKSLHTLIKKSGLEMLSQKRYAWNFSIFYLLSRILPGLRNKKSLQKILKKVNLKLQLFDSWEIYARKI